jgi:hypothetical protein
MVLLQLSRQSSFSSSYGGFGSEFLLVVMIYRINFVTVQKLSIKIIIHRQ